MAQVAFRQEREKPPRPSSVGSAHMPAPTTIMPIIICQPFISIYSGTAGSVLGFVSGVPVQNQGNTYNLTTRRAPGSDPTHPTGRMRAGESESSSDSISSDEEGLIGEFKEDDGEWSGSEADEISPDASNPN